MKKNINSMQKSPILYVVMFVVWSALAVLLWWNFVKSFKNIPFTIPTESVTIQLRILATILLAFNAVFISYFWLNGVKDFIYVVWYYCNKNRLIKRYKEIISTDVSNANDKILLLYCTCNDFDSSSLEKSMKQKYHNFKTVILDDSDNEDYKAQIDEFSRIHNIEVIRRSNRVGFKAGNINNYLLSEEIKGSYDYIVILDSDEILPENFITESLKYFYKHQNIGIV